MTDALEAAVALIPTPEVDARLIAIAKAQGRLAAAESAVNQAVKLARRDGASWSQVGDAIGITRQAAQQRFGR